MYKTLGRMGCDEEVRVSQYCGGTLIGLQEMMDRQRISAMGLLSTGSDDEKYARLNRMPMVIRRHREVLCLPELTPELTPELPDTERIIGEDPVWNELLKNRAIRIALGIRG